MNQQEVAKYMIIAGVALFLLGIIYYYFGNLFSWMGKLPGDMRYDSGNTKVFFPIATCIVITILVNMVIYLIKRWL